MALVYNPLPTPVKVQVGGKWFEFKPDQVKLIHNDNIAQFMVTDKSELGLVSVPDVVVENQTSEESIKIKSEARELGITNRIRALERIKHNLVVSLKNDIDVKGLKLDPLLLASSGEKEAIKELKQLEETKQASKEKEAEEIRQLLGE